MGAAASTNKPELEVTDPAGKAKSLLVAGRKSCKGQESLNGNRDDIYRASSTDKASQESLVILKRSSQPPQDRLSSVSSRSPPVDRRSFNGLPAAGRRIENEQIDPDRKCSGYGLGEYAEHNMGPEDGLPSFAAKGFRASRRSNRSRKERQSGTKDKERQSASGGRKERQSALSILFQKLTGGELTGGGGANADSEWESDDESTEGPPTLEQLNDKLWDLLGNGTAGNANAIGGDPVAAPVPARSAEEIAAEVATVLALLEQGAQPEFSKSWTVQCRYDDLVGGEVAMFGGQKRGHPRVNRGQVQGLLGFASEHHQTTLMRAAYHGKEAVCDVLLEAGAYLYRGVPDGMGFWDQLKQLHENLRYADTMMQMHSNYDDETNGRLEWVEAVEKVQVAIEHLVYDNRSFPRAGVLLSAQRGGHFKLVRTLVMRAVLELRKDFPVPVVDCILDYALTKDNQWVLR